MNTKKCSTCGEIKEITKFHKTSRNRDGRHNQCSSCVSVRKKNFQIENKDRLNKESLDRGRRCLESWLGLIPRKTQCQCCDRDIFFNSNNIYNAIHFDHRRGGKEAIDNKPTTWLRSHPRNAKNEEIWKSCDFGMICRDCNLRLPTEGRVEFVKNAMAYCKI
jgi:hypothetical protein